MTLREVVNTDVDDLEKAIEFYSAAFDLHLGRRLFNGSVAEMVGATSTLHLLANPRETFAIPAAAVLREYERHWTHVHLDFEVENVSVAVERAVAAGAAGG